MPTRIVLDPDGDVCLQLLGYKPHQPVSKKRKRRLSLWQSLMLGSSYMTTAGNSTTDGAKVLASGDKSDDTRSTTDQTLHLIVSSKVLSVASPVFKRMFFGNFKEARELAHGQATAQVYTVELPEDDPLATLILCSILHSCAKTDQVPERPDTMTLKDLAVLADKYHCAQVLAYPGRQWLGGGEINGWVEELSPNPWVISRLYNEDGGVKLVKGLLQRLAHCLMFAYTADLPRQYAAVAATIVKLDDGHMFDEVFEPLQYYFRHDVSDAIRKERRRCWGLIHKGLMEPRSWMHEVTDLEDATKLAAKILDHEKRFADHFKWPLCPDILGVHLGKLSTAFHKLKSSDPDRKKQDSTLWNIVGSDTLPPMDRSLLTPLEIAYHAVRRSLTTDTDVSHETWCVNLCLDCLKTGKKSAANNSCRVIHLEGVVEKEAED